MAGLNKCFLIGNLTRDPELKFTPQGTAICKLGLAVSRKFKGSDGQMTEQTTFFDIVVWGKQGENCSKFLSKGRSVFIEGRIDIRSYETQDGQKRKATEIVADTVQFLGGGGGGGGGRSGAGGGMPDGGDFGGGDPGPMGGQPAGGDGTLDDVPF